MGVEASIGGPAPVVLKPEYKKYVLETVLRNPSLLRGFPANRYQCTIVKCLSKAILRYWVIEKIETCFNTRRYLLSSITHGTGMFFLEKDQCRRK